MPRTKISEFSATPANNTDIDSINISEGCAPSGINDAIRELMAQLKDFQTGAVGDSFNGPVGTSTAAAGAFTTLSASGAVTLSGGTANGVAYLNGSKVVTSGSALTFDGSNVGVTASSSAGFVGITTQNTSAGAGASSGLGINNDSTASTYLRTYGSGQTNSLFGSVIANYTAILSDGVASNGILFGTLTNKPIIFGQNNAESMRLTSTGLGIGTSSPSQKLEVSGAIRATITPSNSVQASLLLANSGTTSAANLQLNTSGGLAIWNYQNGGVGWFNSATIDTSGNVGIGTTSPAVKLDVVGASAGATVSQFTSNETGTTTSLAVFQRSGGAVAAAIKYNATNSPLTIDFGTTTSHALTFLTANTERARIDSSGTFRVKGAGTAGSTDAVQFSGSAPANAMSLSSSGNLLIGTTSTTGGYPLRAKGGGVDGSTTVTVPSGVTTTIYTIPNTATACMCVVFGDNGSNGFCDLLFFLGNTTPQVVSSKTMYGSPPARTYSVASTTQLQLNVAMDSSTRTAVLGTIS
jgi:hypothetical protein